MADNEKLLPGPYEILELRDQETKVLKILSYQTGLVTIYPAHKPTGKVITGLRVHVPRELKDFYPWYWDITSKFLVAQMLPFLEAGYLNNKLFVITKHGVAPKARFTLDVRPAS